MGKGTQVHGIYGQMTMTKGGKRNAPHLLQAQHADLGSKSICSGVTVSVALFCRGMGPLMQNSTK